MKNFSNLTINSSTDQEETIDLKKIFSKITDRWIWFLISVAICLFVAVIYARYTPPLYQITAKVLVNDDEKGGGINKQAGALMDFGGLIGGKNSVDNEVEILKTRFLMEQVVREMQLNIVYSRKNNLISREIYSSPFQIKLIKGLDTLHYSELEVELLSSSRLKISGLNFEKEVSWNQSFFVDGIGMVKILPTAGIQMTKGPFTVTIYSIDQRVASLMASLTIAATNKQVSIIDLGLVYPLQQKGEDILNVLIHRYISSNLEDKNIIADSTTKFIQKRLSIIAGELGDVENSQEAFKQNNKLADLSEQSKLLVQNTANIRNELAKAETQVVVVNELEAYLMDANKNKRVFPTSLLPSDMVFSGLMNQYNSLLVERDKQLMGVTEESPFIINIDNQLASLRKAILGNIQSTKTTLVITRDKLSKQLEQVEGSVGKVPEIEKNYLKLARNQQIKQELYIFLMQKAEETAISKTSNISIAKTIDPPKAQMQPVKPQKSIIYLIGFIFGLIIPLILIFAKEFFSTSVATKEDITNYTQIPIIGEISHNDENDNLIVANRGRSAISEQFRALRTNLSFYLKNDDEKIILLTSSMSGEGKSFTAINLGNILALAGKKVLLMELDLRKPGLSAKLNVSNEVGFSNYTIDSKVSINNIVKPLAINKNMYIVSSGPLPPNPAETLMSERTPGLIEELKKEFDYIIMDAPPIGIITDAQLLAKYSDVVLYLVRQKVTQKDQINIADDLYRSGKMKNIGIVVNDIVSKFYGYGYGYGNYGEDVKQKWFQKIFKFIK